MYYSAHIHYLPKRIETIYTLLWPYVNWGTKNYPLADYFIDNDKISGTSKAYRPRTPMAKLVALPNIEWPIKIGGGLIADKDGLSANDCKINLFGYYENYLLYA